MDRRYMAVLQVCDTKPVIWWELRTKSKDIQDLALADSRLYLAVLQPLSLRTKADLCKLTWWKDTLASSTFCTIKGDDIVLSIHLFYASWATAAMVVPQSM